MLLGKRPRPQMKRTTSVSRITVDLSDVVSHELSDDHNRGSRENPPVIGHNLNTDLMNYTLSFVSPRGSLRNHSGSDNGGDASAHFLRICSFCRRRLSPGRDIYMYMGDTAFCSTECRERKMEQDERTEKFAAGGSKKDGSHATSSPPSAATSRGSGKSQTVAAA